MEDAERGELGDGAGRGEEELENMDGLGTSASVTSRMSQIALAASKLTISLLWRSQPSRSCIIGLLS